MTTDERDLLRRYLAERDVPCPGCGYNLRGLESDVCPECTEPITLRVSLVEPRQGAFIAGLIGLAVGIGFSAAFLIAAAIIAAVEGGVRVLLPAVWPLPLHLIFESAALAVWINSRLRLRRLTPRTRTTLAAACWGLSALLAALFFINIFRVV